MRRKMHIRKGDTVLVISGDSKGQQGKVLEMVVEKERAFVEGVNLISKHTKPNSKNTNGGIVKKEASIHVSNLMLIEPSNGTPTRVGRRLNDKNKLVRYSKKSGEDIK